MTSLYFIGEALKLLEVVCKYYPYDNQDGKIQDKKGDTPYHIVMARKRGPIATDICKILSNYPINPTTPNSHGKKPGDGRTKDQQDERYHIMQEAALQFQQKKGKKKSGKRKRSKSASSHLPLQSSMSTSAVATSPETSKTKEPLQVQTDELLDMDEVLHEVKEILSQLSKQPHSYFEPPPDYKRQGSLPQASKTDTGEKNVSISSVESKSDIPVVPTLPNEQKDADMKESEINTDDITKNFDGCSWEVECTDRVKKFFASTKVQSNEKKAVVRRIKQLADGIPLNNPKVSKEIGSSGIKLYESRYSKAYRIIFEVAVQFSPRLTKQTTTQKTQSTKKEYFYSEVIRLWDIVRDHDKLDRSIDHVVDCIKKSQSRGKTAAIHTPLKRSQMPKKMVKGQENIRLPQYYIFNEAELKHEDTPTQLFFPAGSTRDDEYNVVTFYSFDSSFIKSMLDGENARRDFPFKEWSKEHDIINMPQGKVSILLLGRSGTGKTTCCLYRLWNQFQTYWLQAIHNEPQIPRKPLGILQDKEALELDEGDTCSGEDESSCNGDSSFSQGASPDVSVNTVTTVTSESISDTAPTLDHFHQIFITKNYVLCAQMKKRFYDLAAGHEFAKDHMSYEDANTPLHLSQVEDHAFPLFLTARQFFLLLDNSLQDNKSFFRRDSEGKLLEKIVSSDYDHEDPDTLLDLVSDSEDDEVSQDSDFDDKIMGQERVTEKKRLPQRREVTASYFVEKVWPKIKPSSGKSISKIDPLLVWMEIKSFIKGSMLAADRGGYLSLEDYEKLGRKMAPNFVNQREDIYKIFQQYQDYIQHHCDDNVFDECDLNHNIYMRLNDLKDLPWSIHSIYIDEVQDFTQAELSILIRICRHSNDLFLTGDTAQSIMRGIAFRFRDLKSIFYHASKQASKSIKSIQVQVPKVNQLEINFRSHTGVLKLAASVIDLMKDFFPNSFDYLPGDEGMFPGPTPIVLDSCNVSDLALVLRTNKRESSTIEFGAHQVIIVQSEEAKKSIPDVLKAGIVLTVFESKGLEFDDVLLYDFFKDSKVSYKL